MISDMYVLANFSPVPLSDLSVINFYRYSTDLPFAVEVFIIIIPILLGIEENTGRCTISSYTWDKINDTLCANGKDLTLSAVLH